jgi:hypothetical protein
MIMLCLVSCKMILLCLVLISPVFSQDGQGKDAKIKKRKKLSKQACALQGNDHVIPM